MVTLKPTFTQDEIKTMATALLHLEVGPMEEEIIYRLAPRMARLAVKKSGKESKVRLTLQEAILIEAATKVFHYQSDDRTLRTILGKIQPSIH